MLNYKAALHTQVTVPTALFCIHELEELVLHWLTGGQSAMFPTHCHGQFIVIGLLNTDGCGYAWTHFCCAGQEHPCVVLFEFMSCTFVYISMCFGLLSLPHPFMKVQIDCVHLFYVKSLINWSIYAFLLFVCEVGIKSKLCFSLASVFVF